MLEPFDVVCFSHLRWDFVYQRPQHLMSRCARNHRFYYIEEPIYDSEKPHLELSHRPGHVTIGVPHLPSDIQAKDFHHIMEAMLVEMFRETEIGRYVFWYYTPMAVPFTRHFNPICIIYDCMDELSAFQDAPLEMIENERSLMQRTDLVFTGGQSLFEAKRNQHQNVFCFPSSVDAYHFMRARDMRDDPDDQKEIPHPRIGYSGVVDERMDLPLLKAIAVLKPEWRFIIVGPVVKIDPQSLPQHANVHYLGGKPYNDLPAYMSGWDVAMLPFARNQSTKFISPTKTPEYLYAGKPVVSTSIHDVVKPYGESGLVWIADDPQEFINAIQAAMDEDQEERLNQVDILLSGNSWDKTWDQMNRLLELAIAIKEGILVDRKLSDFDDSFGYSPAILRPAA